MTLTVTQFPVDLTGESPDNRINNEIHVLSNKLVRVIAPTHGPFYGHRLIVRSVDQDKTLLRDTDYRLTSILLNLSTMSEKDVYQAIVILNPDIQGEISLSYQVVGWLYEGDNQALAQFLESNLKSTRRLAWDLIDSQLPELTDSYKEIIRLSPTRYGALVIELDKIAQYATLSNVQEFEELKDVLLGQIQEALDELYAHMDNKGNVHGLTIEQASMYENEVIDFRFSEIPMAPTELLQRPWLANDNILYRNMNPKNFIFLSTSYLGTQTPSEVFSRIPLKEMDFTSTLFPNRTVTTSLASGSDVPGSSGTYHNSIKDDAQSPILETRTYDKGVLTLTTSQPVGTFKVEAIARDHLGNESFVTETGFEIREPLPANMSGFSHSIPRLFDQNQSVGGIRFWGARSATGGAVIYSIESITPNRVTFSKNVNIGENEGFTITAGPVPEAEFLVDLTIKVRITNNIDTLSFRDIPTSIVARRDFDVYGGNSKNWTVPGPGVWRIVAVAGGGSSSGNNAGGGGGTAAGTYTLLKGDVFNISSGSRGQPSSVNVSGSRSLSLYANPGSVLSGGTASGGNGNYRGGDGTSGYSYSVTLKSANKVGDFNFWNNNRNNSDYHWLPPTFERGWNYYYDPEEVGLHYNRGEARNYKSTTPGGVEALKGPSAMGFVGTQPQIHHSIMKYYTQRYQVTGGPSYAVSRYDNGGWAPSNRIFEYLTNTTLFYRLDSILWRTESFKEGEVTYYYPWLTRWGVLWSTSEKYPYYYYYQESRYSSGYGGSAGDGSETGGLVSPYGGGANEGGSGSNGIVRVRYIARL